MKRFASRASVAVASVAAFAMVASPVMARGWGERDRHYRHRDGIDGGDILAGLLVIGGIAAIATTASNSSKEKQERQQEPYRYPGAPTPGSPEENGSYGDDRSGPAPQGADSGNWRSSNSGSMDMAADMCVDEIERGDRHVDSVDSVNRSEDGYRVDGKMGDGRGFTCTVDRDGRIRQLAVDGQAMI